jgi:heme exporter protein B
MWRDALLVCGKDLRVELRGRVATNQIVPFTLVVLVLFAFALGPDQATLQSASSGLYWLAVLFSTILAVQRSFAVEAADQAREGLRLSGLDPAGIFLGKALAVAIQLLVLEAVLALVTLVLYGSHLSGATLLLGTGVAATAGLAAAGTVYGVLLAGVRVRETLLPLLLLPVVAPILLAATKAWQAALSGHAGQGGSWLRLLGVTAAVYLALGLVAFGPLLEET